MSAKVETRVFGAVVTILLSVIAWTGNRIVSKVDELDQKAGHQGETLARFDVRLGNVENDVEKLARVRVLGP